MVLVLAIHVPSGQKTLEQSDRMQCHYLVSENRLSKSLAPDGVLLFHSSDPERFSTATDAPLFDGEDERRAAMLGRTELADDALLTGREILGRGTGRRGSCTEGALVRVDTKDADGRKAGRSDGCTSDTSDPACDRARLREMPDGRGSTRRD